MNQYKPLRPCRCINFDWLELYCIEPVDAPIHDADYFRAGGWQVVERDYGTRQYAQMFTLFDDHDEPWFEIRRAPFSSSSKAKFIDPMGCHIRLHNRACYFTTIITSLRQFLSKHDYHVVRIFRLDLALDFVRFDSGDYPDAFVHRYLTNKFTKINQCTIASHGRDTWSGRVWNSLSWGQRGSEISTKLYCKSLELKQVHDKPYIRQAWFASHLVDDPINLTATKADGTTYTPDIWRLEFSIKSSGRKVFVMNQGGQAADPDYNIKAGKRILFTHTLDAYDSQAKMLAVFAALVPHYFHFKHYRANRRKDRCPDKELFKFTPSDSFYQLDNIATSRPNPSSIDTLLVKLRNFVTGTTNPELFKAATTIIQYLESLRMRNQLDDPYNNAHLRALQYAVSCAMSKRYSRLSDQAIEELAQLFAAGDVY